MRNLKDVAADLILGYDGDTVAQLAGYEAGAGYTA